jgi:hypothetical protein
MNPLLLRCCLLACTAALASAPARADDFVRGAYLSVAAGPVEYDYAGGGYYSSRTTNATAAKVGAGLRFGLFSVEAHYADFGSAGIWDGTQDLRVRSFGIGAEWSLYFGGGWQGSLRGGAARNTTILSGEGARHVVKPTFGLGLAYWFEPTIALEAGWDFTTAARGASTDTILVNAITAGLRLAF